MERQRIVILGAGFGGIAAARHMAHALQRSPALAAAVEIILIDRNDEHTYTPGLYETATTLRRDAEPLALKRASTMLIEDVLQDLPVKFIQDSVEDIDLSHNHLRLRDNGPLKFDKLLVAAGSRATDFGILGVSTHAHFLKSFEDALALRHILTQRLVDHQDPKILVVGGGASGVEVAGEIVGFAKHLCSRDGKLCSPAVSILESGDTLIQGLSSKVGVAAKKRLEQLGVAIVFGARVTEVQQSTVHVAFANNQNATLPYDLLIWTAGIEPQPVCHGSDVKTDERGRWVVGEDLRVPNHKGVYAIGDIALFKDPDTAAAIPATAFTAIGQAKIAAKNMLAEISDKPLRSYRVPKAAPMVIPIGGKWAIAHFKPIVFSGFLAFLLRLAIDFRYFLAVLPPRQAIKFFAVSTKMYFSND